MLDPVLEPEAGGRTPGSEFAAWAAGTGAMTLAARLEDLEVTLEHLLMDVFVSRGFRPGATGSLRATPPSWGCPHRLQFPRC